MLLIFFICSRTEYTVQRRLYILPTMIRFGFKVSWVLSYRSWVLSSSWNPSQSKSVIFVMFDSPQCAATQSVKTGQDLCLTSTTHAMWIFKKFVYKKHKQSYPEEAFPEGLLICIFYFLVIWWWNQQCSCSWLASITFCGFIPNYTALVCLVVICY